MGPAGTGAGGVGEAGCWAGQRSTLGLGLGDSLRLRVLALLCLHLPGSIWPRVWSVPILRCPQDAAQHTGSAGPPKGTCSHVSATWAPPGRPESQASSLLALWYGWGKVASRVPSAWSNGLRFCQHIHSDHPPFEASGEDHFPPWVLLSAGTLKAWPQRASRAGWMCGWGSQKSRAPQGNIQRPNRGLGCGHSASRLLVLGPGGVRVQATDSPVLQELGGP